MIQLRRFLLIFVLIMPLVCNGCVWLVIGGAGVLGGYMISPDTVEGVSGRPQEELYASSIKVLSIMGHIEGKSKTLGEITAQVGGADVKVTVTPINTMTAKVRVKARKFFLPKSQTAQDVYIKIIENLDN